MPLGSEFPESPESPSSSALSLMLSFDFEDFQDFLNLNLQRQYAPASSARIMIATTIPTIAPVPIPPPDFCDDVFVRGGGLSGVELFVSPFPLSPRLVTAIREGCPWEY